MIDKNTEFLQEIEALSQSLSLPSSNPKPKTTQKKQSFWNWRPFKALSHIHQRHFDCIFSLHVHSIENIPPALEDAAFSVHWKRASEPPSSSAAGTSAVRAFNGVAEFDEMLTHRCNVYGSRKVFGHSTAKYEARCFFVYVKVWGAPEVELGKHMVDVSRLLPVTVEDLEDPEKRLGTWSTDFRLSGIGKGASFNVSFGYLLVDGNDERGGCVDSLSMRMEDDGSVGRRLSRCRSVEDVRELHEILPCLKSSASSLADTVEKLEIGYCECREICDLMVSGKQGSDILCEEDECVERGCLKEPEFVMIEQGVEISTKDRVSDPVFEKIDVEVEERFNDSGDYEGSRLLPDDSQTAMEDQELVSDVVSLGELEVLEALNPEILKPVPKSHKEIKFDCKDGSVQNNSFSFDDSTEAIASEFLDLLGIDHSPFRLSSQSVVESPCELLLKQFEEETLRDGSRLPFGLDAESELDDELSKENNLLYESENFDLSAMLHEAEKELYEATQSFCLYTSAELLENAETEALMRKWGINEKAFQCSPGSNNDIGSHIDLPSEMPLKLPPLGEGLGPLDQTKDGGFLRSMSPALFRNSECNASLIMQASSLPVVPTDVGSGVTEISHCLASVGIEKLSAQANKLMPLENVTGRTMQQIAWEATSALDDCNFDPVESPILALVQVEPNCEEDETESESDIKSEPILVNEEKKLEEGAIPQLKIAEVHVAGLKTEQNKRNVWGNSMQRQSGSRWLIANGMGKSKKHPFMKS